MEVGNTTLYALVILIINGGIQWIRELRKGKITNGNGKHLEEIKESLTTIGEKVGETTIQVAKVKTAVGAQKTQCTATIKRFDKAIGDQNKELISLAKNSGRKR